MPTVSDLIYVGLFAIVGPLVGYFLYWPAYRRLSVSNPVWGRWWLWATSLAEQWTLAAFGAALWTASGRSWWSLGFGTPGGWRLWIAIALVMALAIYYVVSMTSILRNPAARASVLRQVAPIRDMMPQTSSELGWFAGVSLTAGFCEEFLFRGYFITVFAPWLGWWGAAALSLCVFAGMHIYQGWQGVVRTGMVGALYTILVATLGSLWPAIVLHSMMDLAGGVMSWLTLGQKRPQSRTPAQRRARR